MITLREWMIGKGLPVSGQEGPLVGDADVSEILDYLRDQHGPRPDIDLAGVDVLSEVLVITDMEFGSFDASTCDFYGGVEFIRCKFKKLNFAESIAHGHFRLNSVVVQEDLILPENFCCIHCRPDLQDLHVSGRILFNGE
jgi:hypothetical protein